MSVARFKTMGQFQAGAVTTATVTIDRSSNLVSVRPHKRRKTYELPLSTVAEMITWRVVKAELAQAKKEKALKRKKG